MNYIIPVKAPHPIYRHIIAQIRHPRRLWSYEDPHEDFKLIWNVLLHILLHVLIPHWEARRMNNMYTTLYLCVYMYGRKDLLLYSGDYFQNKRVILLLSQ